MNNEYILWYNYEIGSDMGEINWHLFKTVI